MTVEKSLYQRVVKTLTIQTSDIDTFDDNMKKLRFPKMKKMIDVGDVCLSLQDLDSTSLMATTERGRSPVRKQSKRCRRRSSSPKQRGEGGSGMVLENLAPALEQHLSDRDTSRPDGSLTVPAVCKKENGSRMYCKKQYCLYCKLGFIKMARHLERAHQDKPEVARAISFPKGSKERQLHMEHLRNKGNFAHNVEVLNTGVGMVVPRKQPKDESQVGNFLHCAYCQCLFVKKVLWRHMKICKFKPSVPLKPGRTRVQALCGFAAPPPPGVREQLWKLLNNMVQDDV